MRALIVALSLTLIAATPPPSSTPTKQPVKPARVICPLPRTTPATADGTRRNQIRKLSEMPPAREIKTVLRTIDGCDVPLVIRENIGGD